jgi:hypothetical protein
MSSGHFRPLCEHFWPLDASQVPIGHPPNGSLHPHTEIRVLFLPIEAEFLFQGFAAVSSSYEVFADPVYC